MAPLNSGFAILETGRPPGALAEQFGDYPAMFARLLGPGFETESFNVEAGELPDRAAHEACLITGSPAGVYEPLPWIVPLCDFIRSARHSKMVGICLRCCRTYTLRRQPRSPPTGVTRPSLRTSTASAGP